jgi:hypothetical protein
MALLYNWKRFCYPRGTQLDLKDYGYLPDPESDDGRFDNPNIVSFESIANLPCLVLIGEGGIGKSTAIQDAFNQVPESEEKDLFELGNYGSDEALCNAVFRNDKFQNWKQGTHQFHLFLDSLDEGCLSIRGLARILSRELQEIGSHYTRLQFRITCRTNEWSSTLEKTLKELWGNDNVIIYEIAPLRKVDVIEAAKKNDLDDNAFLQEIYNREAVPLAVKPISLEFLLKRYKQNKQFATTKTELYLDGCEYLCQEYNNSRIDGRNYSKLTPKQLLTVAARIAAVTIFCNRPAICKDPQSCSAEDVNIQDLWGNIEKAEGNEFKISRNEIEETVGTALFYSGAIIPSFPNTNRISFAHKAYAEFLAAWYLSHNKMSLPQIMSLIRHPDGKLVPQLHETAAWLANLFPDVFREIMKTDPDVLLTSDIASAKVEDREALVETLLTFYDEEKILEPPVENYRYYRKLAHPRLAEQLRPYIREANKNEQARLVAIDIAKVCQLPEIQDDLVEVVTEDSQPVRIRWSAARAINLNNIEIKNKLKSLVMSNITNDPHSRLRVDLLNLLFPDCLNTEELFTILSDETLNFSSELYHHYLPSKLKQYLQPQSLLVSLAWVEQKQAEQFFMGKFKKITDTILLKAFENIGTEGIAEALAKVVLFQLRNDEEIMNNSDCSQFLQELRNNDEKRRIILGATLPLLSNSQDDLSLLADTSTPLAFTRDIPWMLEHLQASVSEQDQQILAHLIYTVFNNKETQYLDTIRSVSQCNPILNKVLAPYIRFIDSTQVIDSSQVIDSTSSQVPHSEEEPQFSVTEEPLLPPVLEPLPVVPIIELLPEDKNLAESLIRLPLPTSEEERTRAVKAAQELIKYTEDAGWATVWPAIQQDTQFGREVIENISFFARNSGKIESRLSEEQVAQLYIWLTEQYPSLNIAERNQSANVGITLNNNLLRPEYSIDIWKNLILCHLKERGTPQAYEALQQISQQLPQLKKQLKPIFIDAQESIRRQTWIPAQPNEIIELAKNQQLRLVNSEIDLLDMIVEALDDLNQLLQGETPAAIDLWNEIKWTQIKNLANLVLTKLKDSFNNSPPTKLWEGITWSKIKDCSYIPKEEERLSDYISRYLQAALISKGIILHREVEIRRGEKTDIYVDAVVPNSAAGVYDRVSVIIEVKGCWNKKDLDTAMKTQLVGRYLKNNRCQYGLYLIGWFNCEKWDKSDTRKQSAPKYSLEEARQKFNEQAAELSQQGVQVRAYVLNAALG